MNRILFMRRRHEVVEKRSLHLMGAGEELEPLEYTITPELNQQYLYAEEDFNPRYIEEGEGGKPWVHPGVLLNMSNWTRSPSYYLNPDWGSIHTSDETQFINPASLGKKLRVTFKITELIEKRGRPWQTMDILTTDEDGKEILRRKGIGTFVWSEPK